MRLTFIQVGITGSIFVFAVLLLRLATRTRMPNMLFYWLWNIAAVLFLVPFRVPSNFSVYSFLSALIGNPGVSDENPLAKRLFEGASVQAHIGTHDFTVGVPVESGVSAVLIVGAVFALVMWVVQSINWAAKIRSAQRVDGYAWTSRWLEERRRVPVAIKKLEGINSPFIFGHLHLQVIFPMDWDFENQRETELALEHELAHAAHFDNLRKSIFILLLCVHWYNPAAWVLYRLAVRDMELFSDEWVVSHSNYDVRECYAQMLLQVGSKASGRTVMVHNYLAARVMRERIIAIMKTKKVTWSQNAVALCCFCAFALFFATGTAYALGEQFAMPQDVGVSSFDVAKGEPRPEVLSTIYAGGKANLKNGDILVLNDNVTPEAFEAGTKIRVQVGLTPVDGFEAGQAIAFGYTDGGEWHEVQVLQVQDGTELEYTIPTSGSYKFYLQSYCTDTIYFNGISLSTG